MYRVITAPCMSPLQPQMVSEQLRKTGEHAHSGSQKPLLRFVQSPGFGGVHHTLPIANQSYITVLVCLIGLPVQITLDSARPTNNNPSRLQLWACLFLQILAEPLRRLLHYHFIHSIEPKTHDSTQPCRTCESEPVTLRWHSWDSFEVVLCSWQCTNQKQAFGLDISVTCLRLRLRQHAWLPR